MSDDQSQNENAHAPSGQSAPDGPTGRGPIPEAVLTFSRTRFPLYILIVCVLSEIVFFILDYHINYGQATNLGALRRMFNTAREDSWASWFSYTQTGFAALTVWFICFSLWARRASNLRILGWVVVAAFFTYMAVDDGVKIHERLGTVYKILRRSQGDHLEFWDTYTWQLVFLPMFIALGVFTWLFVSFQMKTKIAVVIAFAAMGCWGTAVGMDYVEGLDEDHRLNIPKRMTEAYPEMEGWTRQRFDKSAYATLRHFSKSLEECIEMLSSSLWWYLFLCYFAQVGSGVMVQFVDRPRGRGSGDAPG